jgi:hypothetical protein
MMNENGQEATNRFDIAFEGSTEAPLSFNVNVITPNGFTGQLTLRGKDGDAALFKRRIKGFLEWLDTEGFETTQKGRYYPNPPAPSGNSVNAPDPTPQPDWCPIHRVQMKRREKDGQVWYSHKAGDDWCRGSE